VKTKIQSLSFIATLAVVFGMISWGSAFAQSTSTPSDSTPQTQPAPTPDTPPSQQTPQAQPTPTPDNPPATQQTPSAQTPSSQTPDQAQPPSSKDNSAAGSSAAAGAASDSQTFSGTVVKSGDKYMLKDDSGKTYDIDHQTDVAKFEGKRVRVQGKLDDTGTKIMVK
jgi:hypothetical protein